MSMKSEYKEKNDYLVYYKQMRGQRQIPMTYVQWLSSKKKTTGRTQTVSSQLSAAGLTPKEIARLQGKK